MLGDMTYRSIVLLVVAVFTAEILLSIFPGGRISHSDASVPVDVFAAAAGPGGAAFRVSGGGGRVSDKKRLPFGGGGPGTHYATECNASLLYPGAVRDPSLPPLRLGPVYEPLRGVVESRMDYTRAAVLAAWEELLGDPTLELNTSPRKRQRTFLSTSNPGDVEFMAFPPAWKSNETFMSIDTCDFHDDKACDMHTWGPNTTRSTDAYGPIGSLAFPNAPYDLIMHAQTYEHLFDLNLALARTSLLMAPGAYIFASFPAWNIPHMVPSHQRGLSPCGAYAAYTAAGFEVVHMGWFGNKLYSQVLAAPGSFWPTWKQLPGVPDPYTSIPVRVGQEHLANTVWILGRKPVAGKEEGVVPLILDPSLRPYMNWDAMVRVQHALRGIMDASEAAAGPWPSLTTTEEIFNRFPAWIDDDIANVMLAVAFYESMGHFMLPAALRGGLSNDAGAGASSFLASGATAIAIATALVPAAATFTPWEPSSTERARSKFLSSKRFAIALITDLFESTVDPLKALTEILTLLTPDATLLIACRSADVSSAHRASLGTCTEQGLQQLLARAGLDKDVVNYGLWGRADYTQAALAEGRHMSLRTLVTSSPRNNNPPTDAKYPAPVPSLVAAFEEAKTLDHIACGNKEIYSCWAEPEAAAGAEKVSGGVEVHQVLHALVYDYYSEAKNSWAAVVYILVKRGVVKE